jgi:hypothetical protein
LGVPLGGFLGETASELVLGPRYYILKPILRQNLWRLNSPKKFFFTKLTPINPLEGVIQQWYKNHAVRSLEGLREIKMPSSI